MRLERDFPGLTTYGQQVTELLQEYHPGEHILADLRRQCPDPADQFEILRLMRAIDGPTGPSLALN